MIWEKFTKIDNIQNYLNEANKNFKINFKDFKYNNLSYKNSLLELKTTYSLIHLENENEFKNIIKWNNDLIEIYEEFDLLIKNENKVNRNSNIFYDIKFDIVEFTSKIFETEKITKEVELDLDIFLNLFKEILDNNELKIEDFKENNKKVDIISKNFINDKPIKIIKNKNKFIYISLLLIILIISTILILLFV